MKKKTTHSGPILSSVTPEWTQSHFTDFLRTTLKLYKRKCKQKTQAHPQICTQRKPSVPCTEGRSQQPLPHPSPLPRSCGAACHRFLHGSEREDRQGIRTRNPVKRSCSLRLCFPLLLSAVKSPLKKASLRKQQMGQSLTVHLQWSCSGFWKEAEQPGGLCKVSGPFMYLGEADSLPLCGGEKLFPSSNKMPFLIQIFPWVGETWSKIGPQAPIFLFEHENSNKWAHNERSARVHCKYLLFTQNHALKYLN